MPQRKLGVYLEMMGKNNRWTRNWREQDILPNRDVRDKRQQKAATLLAAILDAENTSGHGWRGAEREAPGALPGAPGMLNLPCPFPRKGATPARSLREHPGGHSDPAGHRDPAGPCKTPGPRRTAGPAGAAPDSSGHRPRRAGHALGEGHGGLETRERDCERGWSLRSSREGAGGAENGDSEAQVGPDGSLQLPDTRVQPDEGRAPLPSNNSQTTGQRNR